MPTTTGSLDPASVEGPTVSPPSGWTRRRALLATAAAAMLAGCQPPAPPLRIGSLVFPGYELLFLARERGWLDPRQVRLIEFLSNSSTMRALASHQIEGALLTLDEALTARSQGLDVKIVHVLDVSHGADALLVRPGLRQVDNLRGRRIGVEDGAGGAIVLGAYLRSVGLKVNDIVKVPMTLDQSVAVFRSGEVDAVVTAEPWASQLEATGAVRVYDSTAIPGRIVDVLVVHADAIQTQAGALQAAVDAHLRARDDWVSRPAEASPWIAPRLQVAAEEVPDTFKGLVLPDLGAVRDMLRRGGVLERTVRELQIVMTEEGLRPPAWSWDAGVDNRFVETAGRPG